MLLGIGHTKRAGKDTSAKPLISFFDFHRVGLADAVKELAMIANPLIRGGQTVNVNIGHGRLAHIVSQMGWEDAKDNVTEVRVFLENLGMACREVFGEDVWLNEAIRRAVGHEHVVITDVRFRNEAEYIRQQGGVLIKIHRPGFESQSTASAEIDLVDFDWDHVIVNDSTIEALQAKILAVVKPLLAEPKAA